MSQSRLVTLFGLTLFSSAWLLFIVQPMFAKMVLPLLGGSPAVWTVCVLFFQSGVLAGYVYAHYSTTRLALPNQVRLHLLVLLIPLLVLPIAIDNPPELQAGEDQIAWLLMLLLTSVGLPLFAVSGTTPLLQRWFSLSDHRDARDPYFLYAASNLGSIVALLFFPLLIEPTIRLDDQSIMWAVVYGGLVALSLGCASKTLRFRAKETETGSVAPATARRTLWSQRVVWTAFAFVPSSLSLGVTTFISTDIAVVPLLWVLPLGLYLISFIITFSRRPLIPHRHAVRALSVVAVPAVALLMMGAQEPIAAVVIVHLAMLFFAAMVCHGELVRRRPPPERLTEFYLVISFGGVLGGAFNALVAPVLFTGVSEYPLALVLACMLCPSAAALARHAEFPSMSGWRIGDVAFPLALGAITAALIVAGERLIHDERSVWRIVIGVGIPLVACFLMSKRPVRFALGLGALIVANASATHDEGADLMAHRSFFGSHRVTRLERLNGNNDDPVVANVLYHGTTLHGEQLLDRDTRKPKNADVPMAYYHRDGPLGDIFSAYGPGIHSIGVVGLGSGAAAAYGESGHSYSFFEIDPFVVSIAEDSRYFTYLSAARDRGASIDVTVGDARLHLARIDGEVFDLLILDAFSSDAIPTHLLTRDALEIYLRTLKPGGLLMMHLSNRHLALEPVVARLAADLGLVAAFRRDVSDSLASRAGTLRRDSNWAVLARTPQDIGPLAASRSGMRWEVLEPDPDTALWTDDYTNVLQAVIW